MACQYCAEPKVEHHDPFVCIGLLITKIGSLERDNTQLRLAVANVRVDLNEAVAEAKELKSKLKELTCSGQHMTCGRCEHMRLLGTQGADARGNPWTPNQDYPGKPIAKRKCEGDFSHVGPSVAAQNERGEALVKCGNCGAIV